MSRLTTPHHSIYGRSLITLLMLIQANLRAFYLSIQDNECAIDHVNHNPSNQHGLTFESMSRTT